MDFKLEQTDGTPADPPTYRTGVYAWRPGDTIPLGATRTLRVVEVRREDPEGPAFERTLGFSLRIQELGANGLSLVRQQAGSGEEDVAVGFRTRDLRTLRLNHRPLIAASSWS